MANVHLFLMKDRSLVMGEVCDKFENDYNVKKPVMVQLMQDGNKVAPVSAPFPLPLAEMFLINEPEFVNIDKSDIRYAYSEDQLKKQMIDWYFSEVSNSGIEIATDIPTNSKGLHLIK